MRSGRTPRSRAALLLLVAFIAGSCRSGSGPAIVVERFLRALDERDLNVMLTCVDPRQERMARASVRLLERFSGGWLPVDDLLEMIPGLYQVFKDRIAEDVSLRDVRVGRGTVQRDRAEVPVSLTLEIRSRGQLTAQPQRIRFLLRQFDEGWRIVGIEAN